MKVHIDADEWYPVFSFDSNYGEEFEIPDEQYIRIKTAFEAFMKAQQELRELVERVQKQKVQ